MPSRFQKPIPDDLREPHEVNVPGLWNVYIIGIGIAILMGLAGRKPVDCWRLLCCPFRRLTRRTRWLPRRRTSIPRRSRAPSASSLSCTALRWSRIRTCRIALALVSLVALGLVVLNIHTASRYSQIKPLVIRIDDVGRAEAVQYDATGYQPQPPELRYFLTQFVVKHFSRLARDDPTRVSGLSALPGARAGRRHDRAERAESRHRDVHDEPVRRRGRHRRPERQPERVGEGPRTRPPSASRSCCTPRGRGRNALVRRSSRRSISRCATACPTSSCA